MKVRTKTTMLGAGLGILCAGGVLSLAGAPRIPRDPQSPQASQASQGSASQKNAHGTAEATTSLGDQTDLAVTVYNSNIALVRDVRQVSLPSGAFRLKLMDIAATVNPATVHFRSLTDPTKLDVSEQNYEYDLLDPAKLLHKYVGKEITLERSYLDNNSTKREEIKATLLADNNGTVWKIGNDIVINPRVDSYHFPDVPANLYDHPTLLMSLENSGAHKQQIETSYLANGLTWNADYVLTVTRDDKAADLDGWVTIGNNSGTAFHNAKLQLVAGDLNRLPEARPAARAMLSAGAGKAEVQFQQENFSEYHLY